MIHKEGIKIILFVFLLLVLLNLLLMIYIPSGFPVKLIVVSISLILILFFCLFFRKPKRNLTPDDRLIFAPADGKIVAIEETLEDEFFGDDRIQVSVFMSIWNVHLNWYPISGKIIYYKYHPGNYLVARHPKSSTKNERNTIVIDNQHTGKILIRQIAGIVARRIISNARQDKIVGQGDELGFIRFGSRVDLFLPRGTQILVKPGDQVRGRLSPVASI